MIYKTCGTKPALLKSVLDVAIVGDDEPVPMLQRDLVRRIGDEPDPRRKLLIYGEHVAAAAPRHVPVQLIARAAAASDPGAAALWTQMQEERLAGMTLLARHLHDDRHLRPDVPLEEARDVLWALNAPELYEVLVGQRGWAPDRFGRWVAKALIAALLP
jgi:hypothetical protein